VGRALTSQRSVITTGERDKLLERFRRRHDHYVRAGCHHWVFEEVDLPGAFMEFIEAADVRTLERALSSAPDRFLDQMRVYQEVELD
jgi:hypothetical protein